MPKAKLTDSQQTILNDSIFGILMVLFSQNLELEEEDAVVLVPSLAAALTPAVKDIMVNWAKATEQLAKGSEWDSEVTAKFLGECERQLLRLRIGMQSAKEFSQTTKGKEFIDTRIDLLANKQPE